jgi:hypothetical protein
MKPSILIPVCFLLFLTVLAPAFAQNTNTYLSSTIPLEGGRWNTHTITIQIPASPVRSHEAILWAMETWNSAQEWFATKYFPNSSTYKFLEVISGASVTITYPKPSYLVYCSGQWASGCTSYPNGVGGKGTKVTIAVQATQSGAELPQSEIQFIAEHELGHVLGIGHPKLPSDLMYPHTSIDIISPSTLDLYAVHYLITTKGTVPATITLPYDIPYIQSVIEPIPEFNMPLVIIGVTLVSCAFCLGTANRRRQ